MKIFNRLINSFRKFPGVGPKQAERFCLYLMKASEKDVEEFIEAIKEIKQKIRLCEKCFNYSLSNLCEICSDASRNNKIICVVETVQDLEAIEKTGFYKGVYHVLGGHISPAEAIGYKNLKIAELVERVKNENIEEVIIATNPNAEGEMTAIYIKNAIKDYTPKISRIAFGVPLGGDINYMDEITLTHALEGRKKI